MRRRPSRAIMIAVRPPDGGPVVLVHGAGSFGHFQAKKHNVSAGKAGIPAAAAAASTGVDYAKLRALVGASDCRRSVTWLNNHIVGSLVALGVPAIGVSPFPSWRMRDRSVSASDTDSVVAAIDAGFVPVLFGDVVLDSERGFTVLGGDVIMEVLAAALMPKRVVFVSDVEGICSAPPGTAGSSLLRQVAVGKTGGILSFGDVTTTTAEHDVTGGILAKVGTAATITAAAASSSDRGTSAVVLVVNRKNLLAAVTTPADAVGSVVGTRFVVRSPPSEPEPDQ